MKISFRIFLITLIFLSLFGCGIQKKDNKIGLNIHKSLSPTIEVKKIKEISDAVGYGTGIYSTQGECLHDTISYVEGSNNLSLLFHISNDLGDTHTFTVVVLDNYAQTLFEVNEEECLNYSIEIPNAEETDIPINLDMQSSGKHEIVFLTSIDAGLEKIEFSPITHGFMDSALRSTFIVNGSDKYNNPINYQASLNKAEQSGISIDKIDDESYVLSVSSLNEEDKYISVIVFDNYEEIERYTLKLEANKTVSIPFDYCADSTVMHEITAVALSNTDGSDHDEEICVSYSNRIQF